CGILKIKQRNSGGCSVLQKPFSFAFTAGRKIFYSIRSLYLLAIILAVAICFIPGGRFIIVSLLSLTTPVTPRTSASSFIRVAHGRSLGPCNAFDRGDHAVQHIVPPPAFGKIANYAGKFPGLPVIISDVISIVNAIVFISIYSADKAGIITVQV